MNIAITILLAILCVSGTAFAQTTCLSQNANAVPLDTVEARITLTPARQDPTLTGSSTTPRTGETYNTSEGEGILIYVIYVQSGDRVDAMVNAEDIRFEGDDPDAIDRLTTMELFNLISQVVVGQALNQKYASCAGTCGTNLFRVNLPACVQRTGRGNDTRFTSCRPGYCCTRVYSLCCPDGSNEPAIRLIGTEGGIDCGAVGGTCQSTCP